MYTREQARALMDEALAKGGSGQLLVEMKSIILDLVSGLNITYRGARQLAAEQQKLISTLTGASAAPAGEAPVVQPRRGGVRVGADGEPLDAAAAAIEDEMDAAIAAGGGTVQAPQNGNGHAPARAAQPQTRVGADGNPITDPAQLQAEAEMDAAMGK